jgi:hypothetical protein
VRDLCRVIDGLARRKGPGGEPAAQRLALEQLGDDIGKALVRADVVDRHDVGVVQDAGRSRFLLEALQAVAVGGQLLGQDLDGHLAAEPGVPRLPDLAHPAGPQRGKDFVGTEAAARRNRHVNSRLAIFNSQFTIPNFPGPLSLLQR